MAAGSGLGIAVLPETLLQGDINKLRLARVLPEWSFPSATIKALYPSRELKPAKLEVFLEALRSNPSFKQ